MSRVREPSPPVILKTGARRTVTREWEGGRSQIVKRYHARGVWNRVGDRLRAAREFAALEQLAARGLPVPAPIEVRRRNGQWELILEDLSDAVSLDDLLEGREPWPVPATQVAPHLGRLLAALVGGGVRHGDLHAGNVLVQPDGRVALIDLARVRLGATVEPEGLLVGCAAGLRERDPRGFRARVLAAFRAAGGDRSLDPEHLEERARRRRRKVVLRRIARYWRESGAMRAAEHAGVRGLLARDHATDQLAAFDAEELPVGYVALRAATLDHLAARWERAARAVMHRLPAERPVALIHAPRPRAVLAAPTFSPATGASAAALGALLGAIHDRALRLVGLPTDLALAPDGRLWINGGRLLDHDARFDLTWALQWCAAFGRPSSSEFRAAFLDAQRGTAAERRRMAETLERLG